MVKLEVLLSLCERRNIITRVDEIFIAENDRDNLVSVVV